MSGAALGWVKRHKAPCSQSRNVLRVLADFADDDQFAWPSIATMADELQLSERQVVRYLRVLERAKLLVGFDVTDKATRRTRTSAYWFPIFGDSPNEKLIQAYERKVAGTLKRHPLPVDDAGEGVAHDTLPGGAHVTGEDVAHDTPGVSPTSPLYPSLDPAGPDGPTQRARDEAAPFDRVFLQWALVAPGRLSRPVAVPLWRTAAAELGEEALAGLALRYLAEDPDVQRGRAMSLDRWLRERRWEPLLLAGERKADQLIAAARTGFAGPAEVRAAIVSAFGEGKAGSYLDPSAWRPADRVIEAKTGTALRWLTGREVGAVLARFGVTVEGEAA